MMPFFVHLLRSGNRLHTYREESMALDRSGISVEGRTLLSSLKSRDFNITVRVLLTEPKLSMSEIIQMTASKALEGTHCILPSRSSLGTEVNVIADGFSSIPEGLNDYPSGHTVLLLVKPDGGSEVCLMGASCDETIVADSRLHLLINLEETDGIFNPSVDFDSYVPQGIINDMFSSMKDSLDQYVTVGTKQTVTGQKVFTGTINVSSPLDADNVYLQLKTGGDKNTNSPVSSLQFWDTHRNVLGGIGFESSRNGSNQFLTSYVRRYDNNYNTFVSGVVDQKVVSNHYHVLVDDSCVFFESPSSNKPLVGAWHEAARALTDDYAESTDIGRQKAATYSSTDDYRERIRLRRVLYQEQITDTPKDTVKTYVDLYAQNITNVADTVKFQYTENETYTIKYWNEQSGGIVVKTVDGPVPHDLLTISKDGGVYSTHFRGGYEIDNTSYSFGSAGSLTFETSVPVDADNAHLPTSLAVKDYVDSSVSSSMSTIISGLNLGTASTKNFSTDMNTPENLPTTSAVTSYISNQGFATTSKIPTKTSELTNDSEFITSSSLPTKTSELTNDSGFITSSDLPTYPTIPSNVSYFNNDAGYITESDIPQIPSKTSDLANDSGFITDSSLPTKVSDLMNGLGFITASDGSITNKALASEAVYSGTYDSNSKKILLKNKANTTLAEIDATAFIKDGMVSQVEVSNGNLVITFNTDAGKNPISVPISDIFDANNYYTKTEADSTFLTSHQSLSNYVTLSTDQDITGNKDFSGSLSSNSDVGSNSSGITRDRVILKNGTSIFSHAEGGTTGGGYDVQYRSSQIYQGESGLHIEPKAYGSYSGDNGQLMSEPSSSTKEGNVYIGVESTGSYIRVTNTTSGGYTELKGSLYLPKASEITVSSETGSSNVALSTYIQSLIPSQATVNNATLTIQKNGTTVQTFTANSSTDKIADITVPTGMADLSDASSYTLQRGQEFVEGMYDKTDGFWVQSSQASLYNGMCLNIYVPVRVCSNQITVKIGTEKYRHNIYYRGYGSAHAPVIHAGSMLSITFHNTDSNHIGWYADTYDIAHWKQCPEDFTKNFVGRLLPTNSTFTHTLNVTYGVDSGLNFLMMDTEGNWYPFLARNAAESSAPPISDKSFDVSQIVWDASSGHSDDGYGVFFSSHPRASIKHLMPYITWRKPCDLCRHDSQQRLYSDFDLYMRSCDISIEGEDAVRTLVTSILNGHVNSGGTISGTVESCVNSIMNSVSNIRNSVSNERFPIFICSQYRQGAWEALHKGMYTGDASTGFTVKDKLFAEFVQYKAGAPVWLNLQCNSADGLYPLHLSFCPCVYSDHLRFYDTDACVLVGFMNGVDNLNFIQDHPVYYNAGSNNEVDLRPYNVKEKLVDADVQGSFVGTISLPHGTCYTERSTDAKVVNSLDDFPRSEFQDGDLIFVNFSDGNTSTHPTLNIKGTGAVAVRTSPSTYLGNVPEGDTLLLRYDTGYNSNNPSDTWYKTWYVVNSSGSSNLYTARTVDGVSFDGSANVTHYCTCYTASDTAEKTVSVTGFVLEEGARVTVNFSESNTAANPTLNVHSGNAYTGAKAIMYRRTSSVSGSSDYYRWQSGDIVDFIYDGTNWVMVGWQTYAYHAESATSASTSTYATYLSCSTTKLLTASNTSTVTSSATIIPSSNGVYSLGSYNYKWDHVYANSVGTQYYPVSTAYIENMYGTASNATSDASGNTITSTYLKSVTLVNSSGTNLSDSGTVGVAESGPYVVPSKWPVLLRLTKGSDKFTDIGLRSLLCSYLMGISNNNTSTSSSSSLDVNGAEGCLAILQVYRTSPSDTIPRGRLVSSYSTVSVRGIETAGESGYLEWSSHPASISGTWVAINHTTASSGSYNYCMVLAVRIW